MDEGARFPRVAAKAGHYESFYIKACEPGGGQRDLDPPHGPQAARAPSPTPRSGSSSSTRGRRAAGDQGHRAGGASSRLPAGSWIRVGDAEIGPGRAEGSVDTEALSAAWVADLRRRRRALQVPAGRLALRGAAAEDQVRRPVPATPASSGRLEIDGEDDRAQRLAGDDRPQLGQRARRALGLARGHRLRRRARHLLRRRRRPDQARLPHQPLDPLGDADARRRAAPARRPRRDPLGLDRGDARPPAPSSSPARTSSSAAASPPPRRTSSAGSTPTPRAPSTTPSTAPSPTSS